jgi:hypothetical protein
MINLRFWIFIIIHAVFFNLGVIKNMEKAKIDACTREIMSLLNGKYRVLAYLTDGEMNELESNVTAIIQLVSSGSSWVLCHWCGTMIPAGKEYCEKCLPKRQKQIEMNNKNKEKDTNEQHPR